MERVSRVGVALTERMYTRTRLPLAVTGDHHVVAPPGHGCDQLPMF